MSVIKVVTHTDREKLEPYRTSGSVPRYGSSEEEKLPDGVRGAVRREGQTQARPCAVEYQPRSLPSCVALRPMPWEREYDMTARQGCDYYNQALLANRYFPTQPEIPEHHEVR